MAEDRRMTAAQVVDKLMSSEHADVVRESVAWVVAELMEAEVAGQIGAELGEIAPDRVTHRNGYRSRAWQTRAGEIELAIPKLRRGSYFPSFLEPRRRSEQALVAVVQEAYVAGVSTRKVDQVVESLGLRISKSEVSRICQGLDEQVDAFRNRPLEGRYPYLWLDAKVEKVRDGGRVVRKALVLAYGVHESGYREVIALDVGEAETEAFSSRRCPASSKDSRLRVPRLPHFHGEHGRDTAPAQRPVTSGRSTTCGRIATFNPPPVRALGVWTKADTALPSLPCHCELPPCVAESQPADLR